MEGWIKLHRKIQSDSLYRSLNSKQRDIMIQLLLMASHSENEWEFMGKTYQVKAGQFITSLESIQLKCAKDVSIQNLRTCLLKLEKHGFLTNESTNKNRLITIVKWGFYQGDEEKLTSKSTDNQQATNKQLTTINNEKKDKNVEEIIKEICTPIIEDTEIIFNHWNTKKIITHRTLTGVMKGKIHARLKDLTVDEMIAAINNYVNIISDNEKYWYSHRFTLLEFVNPKNLDRFLTENNPFEALKKNVISFNKDKPSNTKTGIPDMSETQKHLDEMTRLQEAKKKRIAERVSS